MRPVHDLLAETVIPALQIIMSKLDIMLIGAMIDVDSVGIYGVARRIAVLIGFSEVAAARMTGLVLVINVILLTVGISWMGMVGAAWASVAVALVWNLILHTWVWLKLGIPSIPFARNR